ncbi:MAG TPA: NAD(P)/FAD-dependent oxidoreductase [Puia sp.]
MKWSAVDFDAVVVGSGPNGLSAAITLQKSGLKILLIEADSTLGGNMRSAELTLPGFTHDIGAAIHPMAASSPFFSSLPLNEFGLEYIFPKYAVAHPFDDGSASWLECSLQKTASALGNDGESYTKLFSRLLSEWHLIESDVLGPLRIPRHPLAMANFGMSALLPANTLCRKYFKDEKAKGLFAGTAAHGFLPFSKIASSAAGLVLMIQGHLKGWPIIKGGSQKLADALAAYFVSIGGQIQTGFRIEKLNDLPSARAFVLDLSPKQILRIAGNEFSSSYRSQLEEYRYGMGVYKIDWALDAPIPFRAAPCGQAGTIHLGNSYKEIALSEQITSKGEHPEKPFVLLAQQSIFDPTRAPTGKHTAWAYCHVPNGSVRDMRATIEKQVERFAPGFRERILAVHTMDTNAMEEYNPNNVGGSINGGEQDIRQLFTRPALRLSPYRTPAKSIYLCSASTPPGGGVHGMCGYQSAKCVLKDIFKSE